MMKQKITGHISQIIGPVIDIHFDRIDEDKETQLPSIHDAVTITRADGRVLVAEIQQYMGENCVRSVAMDATDGFRRGMEEVCEYSTIRGLLAVHRKGRQLDGV